MQLKLCTIVHVNATEALLESWDRQCRIIDNLVGLITPDLLNAKPDPNGWTIGFHLAHLHSTRRYWHMNAAGLEAPVGPSLYTVTGSGESESDYIPSSDLAEIRSRLADSAALVRNWTEEQINADAQKVGNYDHPVFYLQHMLWHEGWHAGLIVLALRLAGHEPPEEQECALIWDQWRLPD